MPDQVLTPRQLQVLLLRADGVGPPEIADALGIDVETVHSHMKRALKRLDARDAANAMLLIGRMGLLGEVSR
jgi:DNA-binding NarL/FixJ family response regulator